MPKIYPLCSDTTIVGTLGLVVDEPFYIDFYQNTTELNKLDKSNYLKKLFTLSGTMRSECSITAPVIILNLTNVTMQSNVFNANYVYIERFNRYYNITDIVNIRETLWQVSLSCDVLMSYLKQIKNLKGLIARNEFEYNTLLEDNRVNYQYNKDVIESDPDYIPLSEENPNVNLIESAPISENTMVMNYVDLVDFDKSKIPDEKVVPPNNYLSVVRSYQTSSLAFSQTCFVDVLNIADILKVVAVNDAIRSSIISIVVYPFRIPEAEGVFPLHIGTETIYDGIHDGAYFPKTQQSCYFSFRSFKIEPKYNDYRDYEPYTEYEIFIPYASWIKVRADDVLGKTLQISYVLNYHTSNAYYYLVDVTSNKLISSGSAQLGISVPLDTTNLFEIENQRKALNNSMILNTVASAITVAGGIASGNAVAVGGGLVSGARSIAEYGTSSNALIERSNCVQSAGDFSVYSKQEPRIRITSNIKVNDSGYSNLLGKPLNEVRTIGSLKGYTEVIRVHVTDVGTATLQEQKEIENLLRDGIII